MTTGPTRPLLVADGGAAAVAPEHTIAAYEAAVAAGADALGLHVHLSADDQPVVIRDAGLERTTDGRGRVRDHPLQALKRLDAGGWFGRRFRGQRLQTLTEVLERFRERVGFLVQLAGGSDIYPGLEERVTTLLGIYDVTDRSLVFSRDLPTLQRCQALDPALPTGLLVELGGAGPAHTAAGGLAAVGLPAAEATPVALAAWRAAGLRCYALGVEDPATARALAAAGVAGLVTTDPARLRGVLDLG